MELERRLAIASAVFRYGGTNATSTALSRAQEQLQPETGGLADERRRAWALVDRGAHRPLTCPLSVLEAKLNHQTKADLCLQAVRAAVVRPWRRSRVRPRPLTHLRLAVVGRPHRKWLRFDEIASAVACA